MRDRNYLLRVLGLCGMPKLATIAFSLTTLPIVLRSVGAAQYGTVLYVVSALSICEVLIDFGVSSAVGRCLAELRVSRPWTLRAEIFAWARLQAIFLAVGFLPMLVIAHFVLDLGRTKTSAALLLVISATQCLNVVLNFCRPCLQSMLAFKSMSVLDTCQSLLRSLTQLAAAQLMPNALGLAVAWLVTSSVSGAFAVLLLVIRLPKKSTSCDTNLPLLTPRERMLSSTSFLWLRALTRMFQEMPILLIGRFLGPDLVGIIGAFQRICDILSTPYIIVGNALMVRVHDVSQRGRQAMVLLWETALRVLSTGLFLASLFYLVAEPLATALLPRAANAPQFFGILAPLVFTASLSGVLVPLSDYLGGLTCRNALLSAMALLQLPIIILSIGLWGESGALVSYLLTQLILATAYFLLANRIFFGATRLLVRREVIAFILCCAAALMLTRWVVQSPTLSLQAYSLLPSIGLVIAPIALFSLIFSICLGARHSWWRYYLRPDFLDFTQ